MDWKTIISFTDNNEPFRFRVATSKLSLAAREQEDKWYRVDVVELDTLDREKELFDFACNAETGRLLEAEAGKHALLIAEQMMEEVAKGNESWE